MKKQQFSTLILLALITTIALPVSAEGVRAGINAGASTTPIKIRADIKAEIEARRASTTKRIMEIRTNMMTRKASTTERRVEIEQGLAKRKSENVARVIKKTIEWLENIATRIESRIEKVKARGGDTVEAEAFVAAAKTDLGEAKLALESFVNLDLSSDVASENFEKVRTAAAEAKEHIRSAHQNLMMAVRSLKSAQVDLHATTTVQ